MNIFKLSLLNCAVSLALLSAGAQAATVDVSKLGTELTPFGAEKAGNADGSIPAWTGGLTKAPEGWAPGHGEPYAGDKPSTASMPALLPNMKPSCRQARSS